MAFYLLAMVVAISCSVISLRTLVSYTDMSIFSKLFVSVVIIAGWLAPLWTGAMRKYNILSGDLHSFIYTAGYALFGFVFILFSLLIIRDILWYSFYGVGKLTGSGFVNPKNAGALYIANFYTIIIAVFVSIYAFYQGARTPDFNYLTIYSPKVSEETKIAVITDMHITRQTSPEKIKNIVDRINEENADAVVLVGDIIDDHSGVDEQLFEIKRLNAKHGVFAVLGNHEVYRGLLQNMKRFQDLGFKYLHNSGEEISNNVYIGGIPDYGTSAYSPMLKPNMEAVLINSSQDNYKVLLSHSPSFINTLSNNEIDLQISGHTHGGQIFPFHILAKHANKYLAGLYDVDDMKIYVSRGAGFWGPPMRLFAPADVTFIKLLPKP